MDLIWTKALHKVIKLSNEAIIERVLIQYGGHARAHTHTHTHTHTQHRKNAM